jgi:glucose/arabinose dehydrogenase
MKAKVIFLLIVLFALMYGGWFVYRNFRGAGPAFGPIPAVTLNPSQGATSEIIATNTTGLPLTLPAQVSIALFAKNLGNPRVLAFDPEGALVVSVPSQSKVVALPDRNADGVADETMTVAEGLNLPHGLAFRDGKIYIAETHQVAMYDYNVTTKKAENKKKLFDLPAGGNHFSRTIGFGPDGKLYTSIGSSCNVCNEKDPRRAKIFISNADGSDFREYASGLRNSVFFVWHPITREMWATDMGRDLLGDNTPPEEVNIVRSGGFYGWPYCYNNRVHDRAFDSSDNAKRICEGSIPPHITFQAHSAPLGLSFIPDSWPEEYRGDLLVSYHGSWNRSSPTGYKVVRFDLNSQLMATSETDFIAGFLQGDGALGRPVDLLFDDKGALFVSDDKAGSIYRVMIAP